MNSSFPTNDKRHSKNGANAKFIDCVLVNSSSYMYIYTYIYTHTFDIFIKSSLSKHDLRSWHWHCKSIFGMTLIGFWRLNHHVYTLDTISRTAETKIKYKYNCYATIAHGCTISVH